MQVSKKNLTYHMLEQDWQSWRSNGVKDGAGDVSSEGSFEKNIVGFEVGVIVG